jgi:hypothetical protein
MEFNTIELYRYAIAFLLLALILAISLAAGLIYGISQPEDDIYARGYYNRMIYLQDLQHNLDEGAMNIDE